MTDEILNRASQKVDKDDFLVLVNLYKKYDWLFNEPDALFELWCTADNIQQKELLRFLITEFLYIDSKKLTEASKGMSNHIENIWNLNNESTYILATCDTSNPDGSQMLIQHLKNKFSINWKENHFINSLPIGANNIPDNSNIVLIDDFIGTGYTMERKLGYLKTQISERGLININIKIASLAAMEFSKGVLDGFDVEYYSYYWLKKGISELVHEEKRDESIASMKELEKKLCRRQCHSQRFHTFGFEKSETLFALESYNVPNNVFPIFWWPYLKGKIKRATLLKRI